jgi:hypothetical protein
VNEGNWETISSERHFANAHLEVVTDKVRTPSRSEPRTWTIVHRKAAVIVAPITRDGRIVLIRQERIPIRQAIWEMPSGQIDNTVAGGADPGRPAETMEQVASRELREEAAATFFWRVQFGRVRRARRETKENRFSIAANLPWRKFAE